jgi:hypothetical protein
MQHMQHMLAQEQVLPKQEKVENAIAVMYGEKQMQALLEARRQMQHMKQMLPEEQVLSKHSSA